MVRFSYGDGNRSQPDRRETGCSSQRSCGGGNSAPYDTALRLLAWGFQEDVFAEINGKLILNSGRSVRSLNIADFCDVVWAHMLSNSPAMASPFEYRELMKAHFQFNETRSVDEVVASHAAKHQAESGDRNSRKKYISNPEAMKLGTVQQTELDKVKALLGRSD